MERPEDPAPAGDGLLATAGWFVGGAVVTAPFSASLALLAKHADWREVLTVGMIVPSFTWLVQLTASAVGLPARERRLYWGELGRVCFWGSVALLPAAGLNVALAAPPGWVSAANVLASVTLMAAMLLRRCRPHGIHPLWPASWVATITVNMAIFLYASRNWW